MRATTVTGECEKCPPRVPRVWRALTRMTSRLGTDHEQRSTSRSATG